MTLALFVVGLLLFTAGVAFIYWPAVLICLGLLLMFAGVRMSMNTVSIPQNKTPVSPPDFNNN